MKKKITDPDARYRFTHDNDRVVAARYSDRTEDDSCGFPQMGLPEAVEHFQRSRESLRTLWKIAMGVDGYGPDGQQQALPTIAEKFDAEPEWIVVRPGVVIVTDLNGPGPTITYGVCLATDDVKIFYRVLKGDHVGRIEVADWDQVEVAAARPDAPNRPAAAKGGE